MTKWKNSYHPAKECSLCTCEKNYNSHLCPLLVCLDERKVTSSLSNRDKNMTFVLYLLHCISYVPCFTPNQNSPGCCLAVGAAHAFFLAGTASSCKYTFSPISFHGVFFINLLEFITSSV